MIKNKVKAHFIIKINQNTRVIIKNLYKNLVNLLFVLGNFKNDMKSGKGIYYF